MSVIYQFSEYEADGNEYFHRTELMPKPMIASNFLSVIRGPYIDKYLSAHHGTDENISNIKSKKQKQVVLLLVKYS